MKEFKKEQLKLEFDYLKNKYLSNIKNISKKVKKHCIEYDILLNGIPYTLYMNSEFAEVTYIPKGKKILENDFESIYMFKVSPSEKTVEDFVEIKKHDSIIEKREYIFSVNHMNDDEYTRIVLNRTIVEDSDNFMYKQYKESKMTLNEFLSFYSILPDNDSKKEKTVEIRKHKDGFYQKRTAVAFEDMILKCINEVSALDQDDIEFDDVRTNGDETMVELADNALLESTIKLVKRKK